jgi:hypothetical protein
MQLTLARLNSFRNDFLGSKYPANTPSSAASICKESKTEKGVKSPGTFQLGCYYVTFGKHPKGKLNTSRNYNFGSANTQHCGSSELSSVVCRSELPDSEVLLSELPVISNEEVRQELPTDCSDSPSPAQELFDPDSMAFATFEDDAVYELESNTTMNFDSQDSSPASVEYAHLGKWNDLGFHETKHQAFAPVTTPASLSRLQTEEHMSISPSLVSANNSHTQSPVSPVTPSLETARGTEIKQPVDVSPISVTALPYQPFPLLLQQPHIDGYAYSHNGLYYSEPESSFSSTQAEPSLYSSKERHWNHENYPRLTLSPESESFEYIQEEPISLACLGSSILGSEVPWSSTDHQSMRTERIDHTPGWYQYPSLRTDVIEISAMHRHWDGSDAPPATKEIDRFDTCFHEHTTSTPLKEDACAHAREANNVGHAPRYPREKCNLCEREFTGK